MKKHIIISRADNIGDVVLTLPMAALLKQTWPECKISSLVRDYVRDVVAQCPDVDAVISFDELKKLSVTDAAKKLKSQQADVIIHVFPNSHIAKAARAAKIPVRIGSSHRWYHWWTCNRYVNLTRKDTPFHETQLNLRLLAPLKLPTTATLDQLRALIHLEKSKHLPEHLQSLINPTRINLLIHPLTNGHAKEWPLEKFIALIKLLSPDKYHLILTGTESERARLQIIVQQCPNITDTIGKLSLGELTTLLGHADGLLANSTGPLHIAAALGIHTLGLFPPQININPQRWGPMGAQAEHLVATECAACKSSKKASCVCMDSISAEEVAAVIQGWNVD